MAKVLVILIGFLALLAVVTLWRASSREAQAEARFPPEGQIIKVDGRDVHVVVRGQGPDVVLIHGASGSTRDMTFQLAGALEDRYRVIIFDRPGFGYTPRLHHAGATLSEQAALLSAAAQQLGADTPIVMGQSYGGAVALAWAVNHPDRLSALVPVSAASNPWTTPLDPLYRVTSSWWGGAIVVPLITAWVPKAYVQGVIASIFEPQAAPDGYAAHFGPEMTLRRMTMIANARQRANLLDEIKAQVDAYRDITVPTEIIHGTADTIVGIPIHSEPLSRQIPNAVFTRLDGIGHMPQHVSVTEVVAGIDRAAARAGLR
ncbi:MAG: alpha/beta hydrolase [Pseudomonadota bacterium]